MSQDSNHMSALRRTRSTGDVPRQPEPIHRPPVSRHSDGHSDLCDPQPARHPTIDSSTLQPLHTAGLAPTGGWSPPRTSTTQPENVQTQSIIGPATPREELEEAPPLLQPHMSSYERTMAFFGLGRRATRARRSLVGLYSNLVSGIVQIVIITIVLALSGTLLKSPTQPELTEWVACNRPLGIWACIWMVRVIMACGLTYWSFLRERHIRERHAEDGRTNNTPASISSPRHPGSNTTNNTPNQQNTDQEGISTSPEQTSLPHTRLYSRLTLFSSLLTLSWFLTAHILEYTSINTCRRSSPHIWWLTFGILCLMYLMVLEVVLLGFVVFIIAPILFLFWNIFLVCIGRHPLQSTSIIKPDIGKLPRTMVDRIPLVMYIPPPPPGSPEEKLPIPKPALSYPPRRITPPSSPPKIRFKFIRKISHLKSKDEKSTTKAKDGSPTEPQTWEDHWEQTEYPFVVLEGNRASCAICLMDFEEPKRIGDPSSDHPLNEDPEMINKSEEGKGDVHPASIQAVIDEEQRGGNLNLEDAGEGAQPLRLLECGHVFHKTCLDPWLTDVSGRCPVCQRAVEMPDLKKTRKNKEQPTDLYFLSQCPLCKVCHM